MVGGGWLLAAKVSPSPLPSGSVQENGRANNASTLPSTSIHLANHISFTHAILTLSHHWTLWKALLDFHCFLPGSLNCADGLASCRAPTARLDPSAMTRSHSNDIITCKPL